MHPLPKARQLENIQNQAPAAQIKNKMNTSLITFNEPEQ